MTPLTYTAEQLVAIFGEGYLSLHTIAGAPLITITHGDILPLCAKVEIVEERYRPGTDHGLREWPAVYKESAEVEIVVRLKVPKNQITFHTQ